MHRTLQIPELLLDIFDRCSPQILGEYPCKKATLDLYALARTCRTFKEPALDVLWRVLTDSSPLARCLPEASHQLAQGNMYAFTRPLTQSEWDILQSYTRRVQVILDFNSRLDWGCVAAFANSPSSGPLFPRLRILRCEYTKKSMPLLRLPLPSLIRLNIQFGDPHLFQDSFKSLPEVSPNVRTLFLSVGQSVCLQVYLPVATPVYPDAPLGVDALVHLSRMPALTRLDFSLRALLSTSGPSLSFSKLHDFTVRCKSLEPISQLLSQIRLPVVTDFTAFVDNYPFGQDLTSLLAGISTSNAGHTIERLRLAQSFPPFCSKPRRPEVLPLGFEDLKPCMAFSNIRRIDLNAKCNVDLTDNQMLILASAWPKLEHLLINEGWGWNSKGGITLGGLVQLLQTRRSLTRIALCLDTRGYSEVPPSHTVASLGLSYRPALSIDVVDSVIETESMPAIVGFFSGVAACTGDFSLRAWSGAPMIWLPNMASYMQRWYDVRDRVNDSALRPPAPEFGHPDVS